MERARVTEATEKLLLAIWAETRKKTGKNPSAKQVLNDAGNYAKRHAVNNYFPPSLRKTQDILRDAAKRILEMSHSEKVLNKQWSMATLNDYPLPPESIPSVLQGQRYSLAIGKEYTVRQAKWISRLYTVIPDLLNLWLKSRSYATEEQLSVLAGELESFQTSSMDFGLVITQFEADMLSATGLKRPKNNWHDLIFTNEEGDVVEETLLMGARRLVCDRPRWTRNMF